MVRYDQQGCEPWDASYNNRIVDVRRITRQEYQLLMAQASPTRAPVKQLVRNFAYKDLYYSYVRTLSPSWVKLDYVEVTTSKSHLEVELPPWLFVSQEVTDDLRFTSFMQSKVPDKQ
jgi:CYTH domain-containing protein